MAIYRIDLNMPNCEAYSIYRNNWENAVEKQVKEAAHSPFFNISVYRKLENFRGYESNPFWTKYYIVRNGELLKSDTPFPASWKYEVEEQRKTSMQAVVPERTSPLDFLVEPKEIPEKIDVTVFLTENERYMIADLLTDRGIGPTHAQRMIQQWFRQGLKLIHKESFPPSQD